MESIIDDTKVFDGVIVAHDDVKYIIDSKIENEQQVIDRITPADVYSFNVKGYNVAFTFPIPGANISELGYQFLSKYPEYDILASFTLYKGGEFQFRAVRDDINLGTEIAAPIGGGGHPKAAGSPLPEAIRDHLMNIIIDHLNGVEHNG